MDHPVYERAPITEAIVDIDCQMSPNFNLEDLKITATESFKQTHPHLKLRMESKFVLRPSITSAPKTALNAIQLFSLDQKEIIQIREDGFTFNRLAPYGTLDEYLPRIRDGWSRYCELASPVLVDKIRLRYINKISLPLIGGTLEFDDFLVVGPRVGHPDFSFSGFLHQHSGRDSKGNYVNLLLSTGEPEGDHLPIIFDITVENRCKIEVDDWTEIANHIHNLRDLKNRLFNNTLTEQCRNQFH